MEVWDAPQTRHRNGRLTLALITVVGTAAAADAAPADKPQVLANWTQTSASSYNSWAVARADRSAWSAYAFDWTTDYCSSSPDTPFGFPSRMSCARHDVGYRNYKAAGAFSAHKTRLDSAFHGDLERVCAKCTAAPGPPATARHGRTARP